MKFYKIAKEGFLARLNGRYKRENPYFAKKGAAWRHGFNVADKVFEREEKELSSLPPRRKYQKQLKQRLRRGEFDMKLKKAEQLSEKIEEDLNKWFDSSDGGGTWVDISRTNDDGSHPECGENTDRQGKAKCVPKQKAKNLSKKEKERLVRRKRDKDTDSQSPDNASSDPSDQRKNELAMNKTRQALKLFEDSENEPKDQDLWDDVLAVTKGEKDSVSANGETVEAPNDGDGFDVYPSAYANGWASKMYKKLGGEWKTKDENITKKAMKLGFLNEDLDQWFDEEWVDVSETDEDGNHPPCGDTSDSEKRKKDPEKNYPKCVPKSKAKNMTDAEKEKLANKKQKSVDSDDSDQDSDDGDSDEPTRTSSDPDEHFYHKKNRAKITERKLRSLIREEIRRITR